MLNYLKKLQDISHCVDGRMGGGREGGRKEGRKEMGGRREEGP